MYYEVLNVCTAQKEQWFKGFGMEVWRKCRMEMTHEVVCGRVLSYLEESNPEKKGSGQDITNYEYCQKSREEYREEIIQIKMPDGELKWQQWISVKRVDMELY